MEKILLTTLLLLTLTGCVTSKDELYYQAATSISKDNTMSQTACWSAISEIAKDGDNSTKVGAIALAERCKNETVQIDSPKKSGFNLFRLIGFGLGL